MQEMGTCPGCVAGVADLRAHNCFEAGEMQRQERHHDVLCLVLKELLRAHAPVTDDRVYAACSRDAQLLADLAYPPPKAEGT